MFFKRAKTEERIKLEDIHVQLSIEKDSETKKQLEMLRLTEEDLKYIKYMYPHVESNIIPIIDSFYNALAIEPSLQGIIDSNSSTERLKVTLRKHILEMFEGVIDNSYLEKRIRIAKVHVHIGLKSKWYVGAFQEITRSLFEIVNEVVEHREDVMLCLNAINKIINFEQQLVLEAFEMEEGRLRQELTDEQMRMMQVISGTAENLAAVAEQTNASFEELLAQSENIKTLTQKGKEVSDQAEESSKAGKKQIDKQSLNNTTIEESVRHIKNEVGHLTAFVREMGSFVGMIKKIAANTQMLSLNAQIEAAHAGDRGKGFAVVAGHVGELSQQTTESVDKIESLIGGMREQSINVHEALETITKEIIESNQNMLLSTEGFDEVSKYVSETKEHNTQIEQELVDFVAVIQELGNAFEEVANSADELNESLNK